MAHYAIDDATGGILIPATGEKYQGMLIIVDRDDVDWVTRYQWYVVKSNRVDEEDGGLFYAVRKPGTVPIFMHRELLGLTDPTIQVGHVNHNGIDNRRCNLRTGIVAQHQYGQRPQLGRSSKYKGVYWHKKEQKWRARIHKDGKDRSLGRFDDEIEAARSYDTAAREIFGDFAYLNFPGEYQ